MGWSASERGFGWRDARPRVGVESIEMASAGERIGGNLGDEGRWGKSGKRGIKGRMVAYRAAT